MRTSDFDFELPSELIAQEPLKQRDQSRLLVVERGSCNAEGVCTLDDRQFTELPQLLREGDVLVFNNSRVFPGRLFGKKVETDGKVELLVLRHLEDKVGGVGSLWEAMVKTKKAATGKEFVIGAEESASGTADGTENAPSMTARFHKRLSEQTWAIEFDGMQDDVQQLMKEIGHTPLPPYMKENEMPEEERREVYQTVYAEPEGSAAAPTAGLHFTPALMEQLQEKGVDFAYVTLHVGLGTFAPVKADSVEDHEMHSEFAMVSPETAELINTARAQGRRVIAVGTTSARTLESFVDHETGTVRAGSDWTNIFIKPGYAFGAIDGLITNFHLPKSTLLMMVSAFVGDGDAVDDPDAGRQCMLHAYNHAVTEKYRFYSFGDAMLLI